MNRLWKKSRRFRDPRRLLARKRSVQGVGTHSCWAKREGKAQPLWRVFWKTHPVWTMAAKKPWNVTNMMEMSRVTTNEKKQ